MAPVFSHANHPLVVTAQEITSAWYKPHPGIRQHDQLIAEMLTNHITDTDSELIAAALITHSFALAPAEIELEEFLSEHLTARVAGIITSVESEYHALAISENPVRGMYL